MSVEAVNVAAVPEPSGPEWSNLVFAVNREVPLGVLTVPEVLSLLGSAENLADDCRRELERRHPRNEAMLRTLRDRLEHAEWRWRREAVGGGDDG
ncbi:hypothetical protein [Nocardioides sp. KR10-350]|uniref:hypothetical protein n=1 Tax=Nocardioides cheoyonin TaxID=3156615 RepID=UPI0032B49C41